MVHQAVEKSVEVIGMRLKAPEQGLSSDSEQVSTIPLLEHSLVIERWKGKRPEAAIVGKEIEIAVHGRGIRICVERGCNARQGVLLKRHACHGHDDMVCIGCGVFEKPQ